MVTLKRINSTNSSDFKYMLELIEKSFPIEEYRDKTELLGYSEKREEFHNNIILYNDTSVGFLTYWNMGDFYYLEHLAIEDTLRNKGIGHLLLKHICKIFDKPIVLEVEIPDNEMAKRRIAFYQRNGFILWSNEYLQPPYRSTDGYLPMKLMVFGDLYPDKHFDTVTDTIHRIVYKTDKTNQL